MMRFDFNVLDPGLREVWIEVPVAEQDPEAGTARLKFREIPAAEWTRLIAVYLSRDQAVTDIRLAIERRRGELAERHKDAEGALAATKASEEYAEVYGDAIERRLEAMREIAAKGVIDHDPESFIAEVAPGSDPEKARPALLAYGLSEEEASEAIEKGQTRARFQPCTWCMRKGSEEYPGAAPLTVRLYEKCRPGFLDIVVMTIYRLARCEVLTPDALWKRARPRPPQEALLARKAELEVALAEVNALSAELAAEEAAAPPLAKTAG